MSRTRPNRPEPLQAAQLPAAAWSVPTPIRFGHCDAAGIVYTPHYFDLFNGVIEQFYPAALDVDYYALIRERRLGVGYAHASSDFFQPSRMGERLDVAVLVDAVGGASFTLVLHALRGGREVARGRFVSVTTALDTGMVVPIPADLKAGLEAYRALCAG